jgi:glycosyltransferase involved in cell wall biosynthesis
VLAQRGVDDFELVAVDNSPEGSAIATFRAFEQAASIPFRWRHEPRPGVAHARNAALALAQGKLVAWLDDDEEAPQHWLASLIAVRRRTGAQSVFGPVAAKAAGEQKAFFETLYSRNGPAQSGPITHPFGIGNSLQPRAMFEEAPFDPRANETGGEDDMLFASWREAGARFAWAADARVTEHVEAARLRVAHGLRRAFAYGQGPCEAACAQRDYVRLARHIFAGAGQMLVFTALAAPAALISRTRALGFLDLAARGAGKVFWFKPQRFYGNALARQLA